MQLAVRSIDAIDTFARVYMRVRGWFMAPRAARTQFGMTLWCDTKDFIQRRVAYFGIFEPNLTAYIMTTLRTGDVVVDVGANIGYMTLLAAKIVGETGAVVAIEASPTTFKLLSKNIALNEVKNVTALNRAATAEHGMVGIVLGEARNLGSNRIGGISDTSFESVIGAPLSDLVGGKKHDVAFLKIDVEGSEGPIVENLLKTLGDYTRLRAVCIEISDVNAHLVAEMRAAGFRCYGLPNNYRIGYLIVRRYLERTYEADFVVKVEVSNYDRRFTDYVFERELTAIKAPDRQVYAEALC